MVLYALIFVLFYGFIETEAFHGIGAAFAGYSRSFKPGAGNNYFPMYFLMIDGTGGFGPTSRSRHKSG